MADFYQYADFVLDRENRRVLHTEPSTTCTHGQPLQTLALSPCVHCAMVFAALDYDPVQCAYCVGEIVGHSPSCPVRLHPEQVTLQAPSEHPLGLSRGPLLVPGTPAESWIATCSCGWAGNPHVSVIEAKGDHTGHLSAKYAV